MVYTFDDAKASSTRHTQYFEMFGNRSIYHDVWLACTASARALGYGAHSGCDQRLPLGAVSCRGGLQRGGHWLAAC